MITLVGVLALIVFDLLDLVKGTFPGFETPARLSMEARISVFSLIAILICIVIAGVMLYRSLAEERDRFHTMLEEDYRYKAFLGRFQGLIEEGRDMEARRPHPSKHRGEHRRVAEEECDAWLGRTRGWFDRVLMAVEMFEGLHGDAERLARVRVTAAEAGDAGWNKMREPLGELRAILKWLEAYIKQRTREMGISRKKQRYIRFWVEAEDQRRP